MSARRRGAAFGRGAVRCALLCAALCAQCAARAPAASGGAGAASASGGDEGAAGPTREPVELALQSAAGRTVDLASLRGRAVLVVAFVMDDLPSQALLRRVEALARARGEDLAALALSGDRLPPARHRALLEVYASVLELRATTVLLADDAVRDGASPLGSIERTPTTFLLNRAGVVVRRVEGLASEAELAALVAPALPPRLTAPAP